MPRANRTDLNVPKTGPSGPGQPNGQPTQAVSTPTGLPYGENQALTQSQQQAPLPQAPPPGGQSAPPPPQQTQDPVAAAKGFQMPNLGNLHGPSQMPNQPVTAGLPNGIGAPAQPGNNGIGAMLSRMSQAANSPALAQLAARANSLQQ